MATTSLAPRIFAEQLSDLLHGSYPSSLSHLHYLPFFSSLVFAVHRFGPPGWLRAVVLRDAGVSASLLGRL